MNMRWVCLLLFWLAFSFPGRAQAEKPFNLIFILTDNHSEWTLGAYGNTEIRTPHIDSLARGGMRFQNAYSTNSVCSPNRATLLTGLLPSQHGVHSFLTGGQGTQLGPEAYSTVEEFRTLPEILAQAGYTAGLSGKWHLGDSLRPQEGFLYWYTIPYGGSPFSEAPVIWQGKVQMETRYLTDAITDHGVEFIRQHRDGPFFLFLSYNGPYGLGDEFRKTHRNRHTEYYAERMLFSFPREPLSPWLFNNRDLINNPVTIRGYAAAISGIDDGVGRILAAVRELGLEEDTLIVFTGDQGLAGGHHGIWGMGDHTRPVHTFEEGIRVPLIYYHPGHIPAGVFEGMVAHYDFLPTVLAYLGLAGQMAPSPPSPGRDYSPVLRGESLQWEDVIFFEFENTRLIHTGDWKYTRRHPDGPDELYDMKHTPGERVNLIHRIEYTEIQEELRRRLDSFFDRYADPRYDLFKGGRSKARIHLQ